MHFILGDDVYSLIILESELFALSHFVPQNFRNAGQLAKYASLLGEYTWVMIEYRLLG